MKSKKIEHWQSLIEHINDTWRLKKRNGYNYPFHGKDFRDLGNAARIYMPWGVMALWDVYLDEESDFNEKVGYSIFQFCRQLPRLVDTKGWKIRADGYYEDIMKKNPPKVELGGLFDLIKHSLKTEIEEGQRARVRGR